MIRNFSQWPQVALRPVTEIGLAVHGGQAIFSSSGYANFAHMLHDVVPALPELTAALVAGLRDQSVLHRMPDRMPVSIRDSRFRSFLDREMAEPTPDVHPRTSRKTAGESTEEGIMDLKWGELPPVPVRLIVGGSLAYHGYPKLFTASSHASFLHIMQEVGVPLPDVAAWLVGILEFVGRLAIFFGAFVVMIGTLIAIELAINIVSALLHGGFPPPLDPTQLVPSYEQSFLYLSGAIALVLGGSGGWSLTRMFVPKPLY